jgi:hypothetical protein
MQIVSSPSGRCRGTVDQGDADPPVYQADLT